MPVTKSADGSFVGILSDTSMDRDNEFMSKELIEDWAKNKVLPALANHQNKMENFVGGWKEIRTVSKNGHTALVAKPFFFSKEANPLAHQIQKLVEEAVENGLNPGISIGAIPHESIEKDVNGQMRTVFTKAELVEATWVPIQSNRNASFGHIAKGYDIDVTTKSEDSKMSEEQIKKEEAPAPEAEAPKAEEAPAPEAEAPKAEEAPAEAEAEKSPSEVELLKAQVEKMNAEMSELRKKAVLKGTVEGPQPINKEVEWSQENVFKAAAGLLNK